MNIAFGLVESLAPRDRYHALLHLYGKRFAGRTLSSQVPAWRSMRRKWAKIAQPQPNCCYRTAQTFCLFYGNARYFEGYWHMPFLPFPIHHAWVEIDGRIYDPAIEIIDNQMIANGHSPSELPVKETFFGIHVPTKIIVAWEKKGSCGVPLSKWFLGRKLARRRAVLLHPGKRNNSCT